MKKYCFPDYDNSLVNLMASIRKDFGLDNNYKTIPILDKELKKRYRTIVLLLLDGMGSYIMDEHFTSEDFLMLRKVANYSSVFPSTTAAATTVLCSTVSPIESGWLGWHQYFKSIDKDVVMFTGKGYYDGSNNIPNPSSVEVPYKSLVDMLKEKGYRASTLYPSWGREDPSKNINTFMDSILKFATTGDGKQYLYAYWDQPDHDLHDYGIRHRKVHRRMYQLNNKLGRLASKLPDDALLIVTADHGLHDVKEINLHDYPDFVNLLVRLPSIDARNSTFFVKEGKKEEFERMFKELFGDYFLLFTKEEVYEKELFGRFTPKKECEDFIGDYQAVAIDDYMFGYDEKHGKPGMKAAHAGILLDEMTIPLILIHK